MPTKYESTVKNLTEAFVHDLIRIFKEAILDLVNTGAVLPRAGGAMIRVKGSKAHGVILSNSNGKRGLAGSRAAARQVTDEAVLAKIPNEGISSIDLAKQTGLVAGALAYRLGKLRAQRKVRSTGRTSKMLYFLVG